MNQIKYFLNQKSARELSEIKAAIEDDVFSDQLVGWDDEEIEVMSLIICQDPFATVIEDYNSQDDFYEEEEY